MFHKIKNLILPFCLLMIAVVLLWPKSFAQADINPLFNFTGKITNTDGSEIADGTYDFVFRLYTVPSGGTPIWQESLNATTRFSGVINGVSVGASGITYTYASSSATSTLRVGQYLTNNSTGESLLIIDFSTSTNSVTVATTSASSVWSVGDSINNRPFIEGGVINENLGTVNDLSSVDFNQTLYLEVVFNGEIMRPRKLITAQAQAFEAARLGGRSEEEFAALADNEIITGAWQFNNILNIVASSTNAALTVEQDGNGNIVEFKVGSTTAFAVLPGGQISFGAYTFPLIDGSAGYVLKTDGSGNLSWQVDMIASGDLGLWATTSNNMILFPTDTTDIVVIGANATSSVGYQFEVVGGALLDSLALGSPLEVQYGGLGTTTFQANSLLYASADDTISQILPGPNGYALVMQGGIPTWSSTTPGSAHGLLSSLHSDTAATSTLVRGDILRVDSSGLWNRLALGPSGYILYSNGTDAVWFDNLNLFAANLAATTTDALAEGSVNLYWTQTRFDTAFSGKTTDDLTEGASNLYWTNTRFDAHLAATTSLPNLTSLENLSTVGTISEGTWQGEVISVAYGGTGTSTFQANSLVYASSDNVLSQILPGPNGYALVMSGGVPTWSSTSPGVAHPLLSSMHSDTSTSTPTRGDLIVYTASNIWDRLPIGNNNYLLFSDGLDPVWRSSAYITELGTIATGTWQADPIAIAYGGTGATTAAQARANLDLDEIYKFGITSTGTAGYLWQSDGSGRGQWVSTSSLGIDPSHYSVFIGTTTATFDGSFATSSLIGYQAANYLCDYEYPGSYFCRTYDILVTIEKKDISNWSGSAWVAEGPPGYTSNSNDCNGWTSNDSTMLGAFWAFDSNGGGMGWLTNCSVFKPLACCHTE